MPLSVETGISYGVSINQFAIGSKAGSENTGLG